MLKYEPSYDMIISRKFLRLDVDRQMTKNHKKFLGTLTHVARIGNTHEMAENREKVSTSRLKLFRRFDVFC